MATYNLIYDKLENSLKEHLTHDLIPFWLSMKDPLFGGFYGARYADGTIETNHEKGAILNSRILWFFSNCCRLYKSHLIKSDDICGCGYAYDDIKAAADWAYDFMVRDFLDEKYGGLYWSVKRDGKVSDSTKHTYNQAFAIYGLASYYDASKDKSALELAYKLFHIIEIKMRDEGGYLESFSRDFEPEKNDKLSENGVIADRTMNTLLHVMEAYTELYRVTRDEEVKAAIEEILKTHKDCIWDEKLQRQKVFMDHEYNSIIDLYSYGHDIETSWLMDRTIEILDDRKIRDEYSDVTSKMLHEVTNAAFNGSLANECENGVVDERRIWWVQAEAVIGFVNEYMKKSDEEALYDAVRTWSFIENHLVMEVFPREWYSETDKNGIANRTLPVVDEWKCPYHNGRMCIEIICRGAKLNDTFQVL
ncbi:MAG: AGE family epimerase/isomerase [Saccharofermentans sp.]|nr:AGE family epimerase/isomerase [Saccharofermentans sp.]